MEFEETPPPWLADHLALALIPGLGPKLTRAVVDEFGSAGAVRRASVQDFEQIPLIGPKLSRQFVAELAQVDIQREWALIRQHQVNISILGDAHYPRRLAEIDSPPPLLYVRGTLLPEEINSVGIVGSRSCTSYGRRMAEKLAVGLAKAGWCVVSGLARGIDGVAHQAALDAGGRTIAVLANGLSRIYPPEHDELAERIVRQGAIITETPMSVKPQPGMFPARNRVISALSRAVIIVEANSRSGALITATHAAEQGREVFAVPGNADSPASAGCLDLIRKGARLIRDVDDLLEDLHGVAEPIPEAPRTTKSFARQSPHLFSELSEEKLTPSEEKAPPALEGLSLRIWQCLTEPRHADDLSRDLEVSSAELTRTLMTLELKKIIRRLPGNSYERR